MRVLRFGEIAAFAPATLGRASRMRSRRGGVFELGKLGFFSSVGACTSSALRSSSLTGLACTAAFGDGTCAKAMLLEPRTSRPLIAPMRTFADILVSVL